MKNVKWRAEPDGDPKDDLWCVMGGDELICDCTSEENAKLIAQMYNRALPPEMD